MKNELEMHKTSDKIKWILTLLAFILVGVMLTGIICGWFDKKDDKPSDGTEQEQSFVTNDEGEIINDGEIYAMPKAMTIRAAAQTLSSSNTVDVRIEAYVYPLTAENKAVDYSVSWGKATEHGNEQVTNYLTVTPDSDGSTLATVSCKKAFGNDQIIITVTTRDGGYTATCTVSFLGTASSISVTSSSATQKNNSGRGNYYELGTNKTYTFNVNLSNVFNTVGSKNLSVSLGGVGSLNFGTATFNDGGFPNYQNITKKSMSDMVNTFITSATISGNTVTIKTGSKDMVNYYSSSAPDEYYITTYYYDHFVVEYDDYLEVKTNPSQSFYNSSAKENMQLISSCYFTLTVTDSVSGLSDTVKLWVTSSVSGVSLSNSTLTI